MDAPMGNKGPQEIDKAIDLLGARLVLLAEIRQAKSQAVAISAETSALWSRGGEAWL